MKQNQVVTLLADGERSLMSGGIEEAQRKAELLLEHLLNLSRAELSLQRNNLLSLETIEQYYNLIQRHRSGEPVQYIIGSAPFFGYEFMVGEGVFVPRFDTEAMIERLLTVWDRETSNDESIELLDLCCGCGTIGLTIAAERANARVILIDSSPVAVDYSIRNAKTLGVSDRVTIIQRDVLQQFPDTWSQRFRYVTANPPYIPADEVDRLPLEVRSSEPHQALTDDGDGFIFYRRFCETVPAILQSTGRFFVEGAYLASSSIVEILSENYVDLTVTKDLNGIERVVDGARK